MAEKGARELLIDWADGQQHWVRLIVRDVLATRQQLSDSTLDDIYDACLVERCIKSGDLTEVATLSFGDDN